ncbi:CapA family protein [Alloiococcus sp. CFN-8]|uniref:CapA family protein n=1 Tax=Alloiococcus sp. CFN-8 TaxID=3416081 RepID=UPI003CFB232F
MRKRYFLIIAAITCIFILSSCNKKDDEKLSEGSGRGAGESFSEVYPVYKEENIIRITAVGDILVHETQLISQYNELTDSYNFTDNFKYVEGYIKDGDLTIANLETTLAGKEKGYTGFPTFNTPDEILDALKNSGFNLISAANNHIIDKGLSGLKRTAEVVKEKGLDLTGIKANPEEKSYVVKDVKGIKIGISNYVFETQKQGNNRTINSLPLPKEGETLLDTFNYSELNTWYKEVEERISQMKADGAEFIVFLMHWGNEYQREANSNQKEMAQKLCDLGVDVIIGGHPHVIQPMEYLTSSVSGKMSVVFYSLGNFLSNQRRERVDNIYPEDGIIVNVDVIKEEDGSLSLGEVSYVPTWVYREELGDSKYSYTILPLNELKEGNLFNIPEDSELAKAETSYANTVAIFEAYNSVSTIAPSKK